MPDDSYKFYEQKQGNKKRTFQMSWMKRFSWMVYSNALQGALCKVCVLFANKSGVGKGFHQNPSCLVKRPFKNWKDAIEVFENHARANYHREALISAENFLQICSGKKEDICTKLNNDSSKLIKKNREMLASVIQTIIFCGRQEIALRGTDDHGRISLEEPKSNDGNFRSLLRYRAECGDKLLADHIVSSSSNALYTSPTMQNELINLIGNDIQAQIVQRIEKSRFFSVLADATTDIRRTEQFSLCIHYIDMQEFKMREDFVKFVPVYDSTGKALAELIKSHIRGIGLDLSLLRGQGYDGASSMKGQFRGVQAFIRAEYPKAVYTHCVSHCLNLSLADASKVQAVRNVLGTISETCTFFRSSAKCSHILKEELKLSDRPTVSSLKKYCETQWVERHEAVALFADTVPQIVQGLENIIEQGNTDDTAKASALHKNICSFNFIVGLAVTEKMLSLTHTLSEYLQSKYVDLNIAMERVDLLNEKISLMRKNSEEEFKKLFVKAEILAAGFGVAADLPRRVGSQRHRENYPSNSPENYYRQSVFIPYLDELISSLAERFTAHKKEIIALHSIIPHQCIDKTFNDIKPAFSFYIEDMKDKNFSVLEGEWDLWVHKWKKAKTVNPEAVPKYALDALKESSNGLFPNVPGGSNYDPHLFIDGANGVGADKMKELLKYIKSSNIQIFNDGSAGILNYKCGADYVKVDQRFPVGSDIVKGKRYASFDGDADRIVYFYSDENSTFHLLDGDKISSLVAKYLQELVEQTGLGLVIRVIQTAYANGKSTSYIENILKIPVICVSTGVKYLHHEAKKYDIGVYFEANGHGTVVFSDKAKREIQALAENVKASEIQSTIAKKLLTSIDLINETVGDAISDLLLVEAILYDFDWNVQDWDAMYTESACRQLKVKVHDRQAIVTTDADRTCIQPVGLQEAINESVSKYSSARAFVRPSGTEDVVRVYAEAEKQEYADSLAQEISSLVLKFTS